MGSLEQGDGRVLACGRSETGHVREHNEDCFIIHDLSLDAVATDGDVITIDVGPRGVLFGVCDGMGGAAAGEVASRLAIDVVSQKMLELNQSDDAEKLANRLARAGEDANARIFTEGRKARAKRGMGTTGTFALALGGDLCVSQVGDSRAYLQRGDRFVQLTRDQSLVNQLLELKQITLEEAKTFEHSNVILQALGSGPSVDVAVTHVTLRDGDVLLLCSDGLSGQVDDETMSAVLAKHDDLAEACRELTELANAAGGVDNVTVVLARFEGSLPPAITRDVEELAPRSVPVGSTAPRAPGGDEADDDFPEDDLSPTAPPAIAKAHDDDDAEGDDDAAEGDDADDDDDDAADPDALDAGRHDQASESDSDAPSPWAEGPPKPERDSRTLLWVFVLALAALLLGVVFSRM